MDVCGFASLWQFGDWDEKHGVSAHHHCAGSPTALTQASDFSSTCFNPMCPITAFAELEVFSIFSRIRVDGIAVEGTVKCIGMDSNIGIFTNDGIFELFGLCTHSMQMRGQWGLLYLFVLVVLFVLASAFGSSTVVIGGLRHLCRPCVGWGITAGNNGMCWVYAQVVFIHCFHPHRWQQCCPPSEGAYR